MLSQRHQPELDKASGHELDFDVLHGAEPPGRLLILSLAFFNQAGLKSEQNSTEKQGLHCWNRFFSCRISQATSSASGRGSPEGRGPPVLILNPEGLAATTSAAAA
eukprot:s619_g31.t3